MKKQLLFSLLLSAFSLQLMAQRHFVSGGVNLKIINDSCVSVVPFDNYRYSGKVNIPDTASFEGKTYRVTHIGSKAFSNCTSLTAVTFPSTLLVIGVAAFEYCSNLESVTLPGNLKTIQDYAFSYCTQLRTLTIPNSVESVESSAFSNCTSLASLKLGTGLTKIHSHAFSHCYGLQSVRIPANVQTIERNAFCDCRKLSTVTIVSKETQYTDDSFNKTPYYDKHSQRANRQFRGKKIVGKTTF